MNIKLTGSDPDNDSLTFTVLTAPARGTLSGRAPNLVYTPAANFNGPDSFTFHVSDGVAVSAIATINITVVPFDDRPSANAQCSRRRSA